MNPTRMLLLHHWRRTRIWLIPPLLILALWTISLGSDIWHSKTLDGAWDAMQVSVIGNGIILAAGALILVVAMGSGELTAAFPRYAQTLPVSDRRWSLSYVLYSLIVFAVFAAAIVAVHQYAWNHAAATDAAGVAAAEQRLREEQQKERVVAEQRLREEEHKAFDAAARATQIRQEQHGASIDPSNKKRSALEAARSAEMEKIQAGAALKSWRGRLQAWPRVSELGLRLIRYQRWMSLERFRQPLLLIGGALFCQALFVALTLIQRVPIRVFAIAVALILAPAAIALFSAQHNFQGWGHHVDSIEYLLVQFVGPFVLVFCGAIIMYLSAKRERHGDRPFQRAAETLTKQVGDPQLGFASPERALAWYDWMTFGRYLIYGTVGVAVACVAVGAADSSEITGMLFLPTCGLAGLYLAYRLYYGDRHDHEAYLVTLPVTVERLSKSRLMNVAKFGAAAFVVAAVVEAGFVTVDHGGTPHLSLMILLAPFCAWALIWLTGPLFYPVIGGWLLVLAVAGFLQVFFLPRIPFEIIAAWVGGVMACVFAVVAAVWLVRTAKRRGLLFTWNKRLAVLASLATAVLMVPMLVEESQVLVEGSHAGATLMFVMPLFLCLLPAAPFLALPLAIDRYRHR